MAILIEAINVVIQLGTLRDRYPGGLASFEEDVPNRSFCADDHLARVGFLQQPEMEAFAGRLDELGFCAIIDGKCAISPLSIRCMVPSHRATGSSGDGMSTDSIWVG